MSFKKFISPQYGNSQDLRLSSLLTEDPKKALVHLLGYPDDEGILLNGGRLGASLGPASLRHTLFKMTPGFEFTGSPFIYDQGDLSPSLSLEGRHQMARTLVKSSYIQNKFVLTFGGGHDYGFSDAAGFLDAHKKSKLKPVVINFDAHLDVRPTNQGLTSGTPFFRLIEEKITDFNFLEVGIQEHCNSAQHLAWLNKKKASLILQSDISKNGLKKSLQPFLKKWKNHPTFISLDIDVFASSEAPGCSQSWPVGISSQEFFEILPQLMNSLSVQGLGVYEVSPPLDVSLMTSRLAALIVYRTFQLKGYL